MTTTISAALAALAALPIDQTSLSAGGAICALIFSKSLRKFLREILKAVVCLALFSWAFDWDDFRELVRDVARKLLKGK